MLLTLASGGNYAVTYTMSAVGPGWHNGTFTPANLPDETPITFTVVGTVGAPAGPSGGSTWQLMYTDLKSSSAVFWIDLGSGLSGPYAAIRQ